LSSSFGKKLKRFTRAQIIYLKPLWIGWVRKMTGLHPVVFKNRAGLKLYGIHHKAKGRAKHNILILMLSPGIKMRVAPHRLYKKMAEKYVELGFDVLRYDFYGLGDSEGKINDPVLADVYNSVANGRFVDDVYAVVDWAQEHLGYEKFVACGLCGGAITGLLAAEHDRRIIALLSLGMPVIYEISGSDRSRYITKGQLNSLADGYWENLLKAKSWARLITFQSDYKILLKSLKQYFAKKFNIGKNHRKGKDSSSKPTVDNPAKGNLNPKFAPAFFRMAEDSRKILLIFSGADRLGYEFEEKFETVYFDDLQKYQKFYEKYTIQSANHVLSLPKWQDEMLDISCRWLNGIS
jgi:pimeloyl-ACP methyl ester carboxylesterase